MDLSQNSQIRGKNVPCCNFVKQMTQLTHDWAIVLYENFRIWLTLISEMGVVPCFLFNRRHRILKKCTAWSFRNGTVFSFFKGRHRIDKNVELGLFKSEMGRGRVFRVFAEFTLALGSNAPQNCKSGK